MVALTTVQITNDTGKTANIVTHHNNYGHLKPKPDPDAYPQVINNGETVYFVFGNQNGDHESSGAVVYRGENEEGNKFDWMYAWYNKDGANPLTHKAYTEIADAPKVWNWDEVWEKLMKSVPISHAEYDNCVSDAIISQPLYPVTYQGRMSRKGGSTT